MPNVHLTNPWGLRLPEHTRRAITDYATAQDRTITEVVNEALREYLRARGVDPDRQLGFGQRQWLRRDASGS